MRRSSSVEKVIVYSLKKHLLENPKSEKVAQRLRELRDAVFAEQENEHHLSKLLGDSGLLSDLLEALPHLPFETRKDGVLIFNNLLLRQGCPLAGYFQEQPESLNCLLISAGSSDASLAHQCGDVLRRCARTPLASILLHSSHFFDLFLHLRSDHFAVAMDAFNTLAELLEINADHFSEQDIETICQQFHQLLESDNYFVRRQTLTVLSDLLAKFKRLLVKFSSRLSTVQLLASLLANPNPLNLRVAAFKVIRWVIFVKEKPDEVQLYLKGINSVLRKEISELPTGNGLHQANVDEHHYILRLLDD